MLCCQLYNDNIYELIKLIITKAINNELNEARKKFFLMFF